MPVLHPAELWRRSGRYDAIGPELFRLQDRRGRRDGAGHDARGGRDLPRRQRGALLPRPAADPLPLPGQGARRAAPARRGAAHARVHHEGLLHLRPRRGGPAGRLRQAHRGLRPDLRPLRPRVVPGGVRRRDDGRHARPRVHGAVPGRRERRRARARVRRERRDRLRRAAGRRAAAAAAGARGGGDPGAHDGGRGGRPARAADGRAAEGLPRRRGGARPADGRRARRPPRQRDQAAQRARRAVPARDARRRSPTASGRPARSARSGPTSPCCWTRASGPAAT